VVVSDLLRLQGDELGKVLMCFAYGATKRVNGLSDFLAMTYVDADDAAQEAFLYLWRSLKQYDPKRSPFKLFATVKCTTGVRHFMSKVRPKASTFPLDDALNKRLPRFENVAVDGVILRELLSKKPEKIRRMMLYLMQGYTTYETAAKLGCSQAYVSGCLKRLRAQLAEA
jgi:RNA polymerase sigma factor (sigma-70 family)